MSYRNWFSQSRKLTGWERWQWFIATYNLAIQSSDPWVGCISHRTSWVSWGGGSGLKGKQNNTKWDSHNIRCTNRRAWIHSAWPCDGSNLTCRWAEWLDLFIDRCSSLIGQKYFPQCPIDWSILSQNILCKWLKSAAILLLIAAIGRYSCLRVWAQRQSGCTI